jgi:hypothetical protein
LSKKHQKKIFCPKKKVLSYLAEAGRVDRLHGALAAEVDVVEVDHVPGDAHPLRQLVVALQPAQRGGGGVRPQPRRLAVVVGRRTLEVLRQRLELTGLQVEGVLAEPVRKVLGPMLWINHIDLRFIMIARYVFWAHVTLNEL